MDSGSNNNDNSNVGATPPQSATEGATTPSVIGAQTTASEAPAMPQSTAPVGAVVPSGKKKVVIASVIGLAVLLVGSSAGAYFGYIVPNKPENIWATALQRTSDGYDRLVKYAEEHKDEKSATVAGNLKLEGDFETDGTIKGSFDQKNAVLTGDIGIVTSRIKAEVRAIDAPNSENPDLYIKAEGLKGLDALLGEGAGTALAEEFDGQWLEVDHTLLDNLSNQALAATGTEAATGLEELTNEEMLQIVQAVGQVNREYLFTTDQSKAVFKVVKEVGKETQDGRSVYHFTVGLDKEHAKAYLDALAAKLDSTPAKKLFDGQSAKEALTIDDLKKEVDKYKDSETADVYVDMTTKTLRTIKFTDTKNTKNVLELKMPITDTDVIPFVIKFTGDEDGTKTAVDASVTVNTKSNTYDFGLNFDFSGDGQKQSGKATLKVTPSNDAVKAEKPAGAKSVNELLSNVFGSGLLDESGDPSSAGLFDDSAFTGI